MGEKPWCNLCLGDLWRMLTIEWATLSSQRQMGSAKTKRVERVGTQTSPIPLTPLMFSGPQHGFPHWKGQHNHVSYCCLNMLKANWQGHFSHLLAILLNKNCLGKALAWENNLNTWFPGKAHLLLFFGEKLNILVCCLFLINSLKS